MAIVSTLHERRPLLIFSLSKSATDPGLHVCAMSTICFGAPYILNSIAYTKALRSFFVVNCKRRGLAEFLVCIIALWSPMVLFGL